MTRPDDSTPYRTQIIQLFFSRQKQQSDIELNTKSSIEENSKDMVDSIQAELPVAGCRLAMYNSKRECFVFVGDRLNKE